jgi:hypothetical protein
MNIIMSQKVRQAATKVWYIDGKTIATGVSLSDSTAMVQTIVRDSDNQIVEVKAGFVWYKDIDAYRALINTP